MRKHILAIGIILCMSLGLIACGAKESGEPGTRTEATTNGGENAGSTVEQGTATDGGAGSDTDVSGAQTDTGGKQAGNTESGTTGAEDYDPNELIYVMRNVELPENFSILPSNIFEAAILPDRAV